MGMTEKAWKRGGDKAVIRRDNLWEAGLREWEQDVGTTLERTQRICLMFVNGSQCHGIERFANGY